MKHILSLSGGKDSSYLLYKLIDLNLPLDDVVCAVLPFEEPEMVEHLTLLDNYLFDKKGFHISFVKRKDSIEPFMGEITKRGKHKGTIRGFPLAYAGFCWISRDWKINPLQKYLKSQGDHILYMGFAVDEKNPNRQLNIKSYLANPNNYKLNHKVSYPLADLNLTEKECLQGLKDVGLFSEVLGWSNRSGCWFCPKAKKETRLWAIKRFPERVELIKKYIEISGREIYPDLTIKEIQDLMKVMIIDEKKIILPHKCDRCSAILWFNDLEKNYIYSNKTGYRCKGCFKLWGTK